MVWHIFDLLEKPTNPMTPEIVSKMKNSLLLSCKKRLSHYVETPTAPLLAASIHPFLVSRVNEKISIHLKKDLWNTHQAWINLLQPVQEEEEEETMDDIFGCSSSTQEQHALQQLICLKKKLDKASQEEQFKFSIQSIFEKKQLDDIQEHTRQFYFERITPASLAFKLFLLIYSCPGSSATAERVFRAVGILDSALRGRLNSTTLEKMAIIYLALRKLDQNELDSFFLFCKNDLTRPL